MAATFGGMQAVWAWRRTAQLTAQLGNELEGEVGTIFWAETRLRRAIDATVRREELVFFVNAMLQCSLVGVAGGVVQRRGEF